MVLHLAAKTICALNHRFGQMSRTTHTERGRMVAWMPIFMGKTLEC